MVKATQGEVSVGTRKQDREEFVAYIREIIDSTNVLEERIYSATGWRKMENGQHFYIDADGAVGHPEIPVKCSSNLRILHPEWRFKHEDYIRETLGMMKICHDGMISSMLFLYFHTALLTTLFDESGIPIKFVLGCIGISNSKKTTVAALMSQLFNRNRVRPEITFSSTEGGIEIAISKYGDAILMLDDFMPGGNRQKQNQLQGKLEAVLRAYGDRVVKQRMTAFSKNVGELYNPVKGCCLITGEQISGVYSTMSRIIVLQQTANSVDLEWLTYYQNKPHILAQYAYDFLADVTDNYDEILRFIEKRSAELRNQQVCNIPRMSEAYAILMTTKGVLMRFLEKTQRFSFIELEQIDSGFDNVVLSVLRENDLRLRNQDMLMVILEALEEAIISGKIACVEKNTFFSDPDTILYDSEFVYVRLDTYYAIIKDYIVRYDSPIALAGKRQLATYLDEAGVLASKIGQDGKKENTRKIIGLPDNHVRYLYLQKNMIEKKLKERGTL